MCEKVGLMVVLKGSKEGDASLEGKKNVSGSEVTI